MIVANRVQGRSYSSDNKGEIEEVIQPIQMIRRMRLLVLILALLAVGASCVLAQQPGEYKLGPEDVIVVTTMGKQEFSGEFMIPQDGSINFPGIGLITVTGKTVIDLGKEIEGALGKRLQRPEVYVTLKSQRQQLVYVLGAVGRTGPMAIKPGWRLSEVMSAAGGGASGEPADFNVTLFKPNGSKETVAMTDVLAGTPGKNLVVEPNDLIVVDKVEQYQVYVAGKVRSPGVFPIRKDSNGLLNVLAMAGGATEDGAVTRAVVTHANGQSEIVDLSTFLQSGKMDGAPKVMPGDLIVIPESRKKIAVMGWVRSPNVYNVRDNEVLTLSDMLSMAGGVDQRRGGTGKIAILRQVNGEEQRMVFDYRKYISKADTSQNPVVMAGDLIWVPETDSIDWDRWISRLATGLSTWYTIDRVTGND